MPLLNKAQFFGMREGRPLFEFGGHGEPPKWLLRALRNGRIRVVNGLAYLGGRELIPGDVVASKDVL